MCTTNDTTGGCCSTTLSIGRPGERADAPAMASGPRRSDDLAPTADASSQAQTEAGASGQAGGPAFTTAFGVEGMTCGHCVASVTEEVGRLDGVSSVQVDLVAGGVSTVTVQSAAAIDRLALAEAVDEAGYELADLAS
jgi:copper chaperone